MLRFTLLTFAFLACGNAFADFSGTWIATNGHATGADTADCSTIQLHITQTATALIIENAEYNCGGLTISAGSLPFDISGHDLLMQGQKYGEITSDTLGYDFVGSGGSYSFRLVATPSGVAYTQHLSASGLSDDVTATLKRQ